MTLAKDVIDLAEQRAKDWFELQREADVPDLDPDNSVWAELNARYPENAAASESAPTPLDRLFETAFRAEMARRWWVRSFQERDALERELRGG